MRGLELKGVSKSFGSTRAVEPTDLSFPEGQLTALLGPSGCGKTTLLRMIAGLEAPTHGRILLGQTDITALPAHKRKFGMVFQSFALFPHYTVRENVAYSLTIGGVDKAAATDRADALLKTVQLGGFGDRRIGELSGGQRQRVAIARALAQEPDVFLLDEPMSALDAKLREEMQVELRLLQQRLGITTIVVTHDQREAMTMADRIVVMSNGRVEQVAAPQDIYTAPPTRSWRTLSARRISSTASPRPAVSASGPSTFRGRPTSGPAVPSGSRSVRNGPASTTIPARTGSQQR